MRRRVLGAGEFIGSIARRAESACASVCFVGAVEHVEPHEHTDTHFVLITSGAYDSAARGADEPVGPRGVIYNPPGTRHRDAFRGAGALVTVSPAEGFLSAHLATPRAEGSRLLGDRSARLFNIIVEETLLLDAASTLSIEAACLELLASTSGGERRSPPPPWIRRACEQIDDACEEDVRIATLAAEARVHPVYFARAFRRHVGASPGDYLRRRRAARAARLLTGTAPLVEIALACGFADQPAFTKAFSRSTGITPGAFRARWRG